MCVIIYSVGKLTMEMVKQFIQVKTKIFATSVAKFAIGVGLPMLRWRYIAQNSTLGVAMYSLNMDANVQKLKEII